MNPTALLLTGTVGAGKTTTATFVGEHLAARGVPHAVVDLDQIRQCWPAPADDPFNQRVELANLRAMASTYLTAGAQRLVLAGVVESRSDRARYAEVLGISLVVCRLRVDLATVRQRLRRRHAVEPGLAWHLHRAGELDQVLETAAVEDFLVEVSGHSPEAVAELVLQSAGW